MRLHHLALCVLAACVLAPPALAGDQVGKAFPNFDAVDPLTRKKFQLSDFRGRVVLVDFWATWCGPCRAEIPNVKSVYNKYKDKGFEIISISLDEDASKFRSYANSNGMNWVHVMDGGGWSTRLAKKYGIRSIPAMFLIDHEGVCISDSARGPRLESAVENAVKKLPATPTKQDEQPSSGKGPATIDRIRADLEQLSQQLTTTLQGPQGYLQQIQDVRKLLESKPSGASAGSAADESGDACAALKTSVVQLRSELFALGALNGVRVTPPGASPTGTAEHGVQECVAAARSALDALEQAVAGAAKSLEVITGQVAEFRTQLAKEPITLQQARQKFTTLNNNASKAMQKWSSAWQTQLNDLDAMLAPLGESDSAVNARLASAEKAISELRVRAMSQSRSSRNDQLLRDEYQKIRTELMDLCKTVCANPAECKMPADVYATRSANDPLVMREVEAQLVVAGQAARHMKPLVTKAAERGKQLRMSFAKQVTALQDEVKKASNDSATLESLREKFVALCGEILAATE
jgi:thiol-disulfide isomerase/thioredoxin